MTDRTTDNTSSVTHVWAYLITWLFDFRFFFFFFVLLAETRERSYEGQEEEIYRCRYPWVGGTTDSFVILFQKSVNSRTFLDPGWLRGMNKLGLIRDLFPVGSYIRSKRKRPVFVVSRRVFPVFLHPFSQGSPFVVDTKVEVRSVPV